MEVKKIEDLKNVKFGEGVKALILAKDSENTGALLNGEPGEIMNMLIDVMSQNALLKDIVEQAIGYLNVDVEEDSKK